MRRWRLARSPERQGAGCRSRFARPQAHLTAPVIIDAAEHRCGLPHAFVSSRARGTPVVNSRLTPGQARGRLQWGPGHAPGSTPGWGLRLGGCTGAWALGAGASCLVSRDRRVFTRVKVMFIYVITYPVSRPGPPGRPVPVPRTPDPGAHRHRRLHAKEDKERKRKVAPRATYPRGPWSHWTANTAVATYSKPNRNPCTCTGIRRPTRTPRQRHAPRQPTPNILTKKPTEETRCTHTTQPGRTVVAGNAQRLVSGSVRPTPHGGEE